MSGWRTTYAAAISVIFHAGYALATSVTLLRGIHLPDCGCFGIFFQHPLEWPMVRGDAILTLVSVVLYALARYEMRSGRTAAPTG